MRLRRKMTAEEFTRIVGRKPEDDDLDRVNCDKAGLPGHLWCGVCNHDKPMFICTKCWQEEQDSTHT